MEFVIGLDLGTTSAKAVAVNEEGRVLASASTGYDLQTTRPRRAVQEASAVWKGLQRALQELGKSMPLERASGLGVSGAMHSLLPATTSGQALAPALTWVDSQAAPEARLKILLDEATVAVVGAYGAIGSVTAELLASEAGKMLLIGRRMPRLDSVATRLREQGCPNVETTTNVSRLVDAELVITVTSDVDAVIQPHHLRPGAVVCDVARPRDVSKAIAAERPDVLVIEGGMVRPPGPVEFNFDFGFPPGMAYACMAETMALALEGRYESFTLGKEIKLSQVRTIDRIARRHGFLLGGFRSFERAVTEAEIRSVEKHSRVSRARRQPAS